MNRRQPLTPLALGIRNVLAPSLVLWLLIFATGYAVAWLINH